jgi:hypothetical protein
VQHGFLLGNGVFTPIDFPGAALTQALGINAAGYWKHTLAPFWN